MTYRNALKDFKQLIVPHLPGKDKPAIRQAWSNFIDDLHRNGEITDKQVQNWCLPSNLG